MTARIDAAREELRRAILDGWDPGDIDAFVRLLRRFADGMMGNAVLS